MAAPVASTFGYTTVETACPATKPGLPARCGLSGANVEPRAAVGVIVCMFGSVSPANATDATDATGAAAQHAAMRATDTDLALPCMKHLRSRGESAAAVRGT